MRFQDQVREEDLKETEKGVCPIGGFSTRFIHLKATQSEWMRKVKRTIAVRGVEGMLRELDLAF